jgi:hypothetical protein
VTSYHNNILFRCNNLAQQSRWSWLLRFNAPLIFCGANTLQPLVLCRNSILQPHKKYMHSNI